MKVAYRNLEYVLASDVIPLFKTIDSSQLSPIKFYEALGLGKFLLVTDVDYINMVDDLGYGKKVSLPLNTEEIKESILYVTKHIEAIRAKRDELTKYAILNLSWESRVQEILQKSHK